MFARIGSLTFRFRYLVVAGWIALAAGAVLFAPSLAQEGMTNQSDFLPAGTESVQARDALERAFPGATAASSASLSFAREAGLTDADRAYLASTAAWLTSGEAPAAVRDAVTGVATVDSRPELASMLRSADGKLEMMAVNLDVTAAGSGADAVISAIREHLVATAPAGLDAHVTGSAAISTDYLAAIVKGTESTTLVTVLLVVVILLLIYRAPLAALVPLITIGAAFLVSRGVLGVLAAAGWHLSSLLDTFIVVLVFGVGTDYAIFLISRFREEVTHDNWHHASRTTVRRIGAVISASAATVIVGLGSMAFANFGMIQTMGPALAVAIFVTLIAGLTLTPALLAIFGHYLFWPQHLRARSEGDPGGFFARLAGAVSRRPGIVTVGLLVVLLIPAVTVGRMQTNFDVLAELPADSDARAGFDQVAAHLGRGKVVQSTGVISAGTGSDLLAPASLARLRDVTRTLVATDGIASVTSLVSPEGDGVVPDGFKPSSQLAEMATGFATDTSSDAETGAGSLLDPKVDEGLTTATEYLALLGDAFPDVAAGTGFRDATTDLASARDQVRSARDSAVVTTQLRELSTALTSPTAAAGGTGTTVGIVGDYLDELGSAFPAARDTAPYRSATAAAGRLETKVSIAAALDLSSGLSSLATWFETNDPEATLVPQSLAGTTEARQRRAEVEATFGRLQTELSGLSASFATRSDDLFVPAGLSGTAGTDVAKAVSAFVAGDRSATRFYLTTTDDPYSQPAFGAIRAAQDVLTAAAPGFGASAGAYMGGPTAEFADVQSVLAQDFQQVAIVTIVGILVVLVLLLRAVVAPLYLVGTVLLSCATALGLSAWFFQSVMGEAGVSFYLPLLVFVLLVALGSDYNIFLMSRVREESETRPIREAIRVASGRTGAVITSAGLILAGTFGSMATAPLAVLVQVGVAVAVGVLIDTFVVRSILVPAIATLTGEWSWWPSGANGLGRIAWPITVAIPAIDGTAAGVGAADPGVAPEGAAGRSPSRRRLAVAVALAALVPMLFAGLLTSSLADPTAHLSRVTAAVVDEDEGATTTAADGTVTKLDLGADLVARLTGGTAGDTFAWRTTDAADAREGLAAGRYAAALTIPADFSRTIATIRNAGGTATPKATLGLATNDASGSMVAPIARSVSDAIARSTAKQVIASYVDDVLLSAGSAQDRLAGAATDASKVVSSTRELADGASGTSTVAGELVTGLKALAAGTTTASTGAKALAAGVSELASGTARLSSGAASLADGAAGIASANRKLADALKTMATGTKGLGAQANALDKGAESLAAGVATYTGSVAVLSANCAALGGTDVLCGQLAALAAGGPDLATGASGLAAGTARLASSAPALETGLARTAKGARELAAGSSKVAAGARTLATGARSAASGASTLASGTTSAASGVSQLSSGIRDAVDGARMVAAETEGLANDGRSVTTNARALSDGLKGGSTSAPTLSQAERRAVGEVVADPIVVESQPTDGVEPTGSGLAPSFMALALWVGVLATYLVLPALPRRIRRPDGGSGALVWFLVAAGLGVVQIVLMVVALRWAVGVEVARFPELVALAVVAMVAAVAVVQALVALFGTRGWFVALLLVVLQAAASGAWYPIETAPAFFQALHPILPMTYAVDAFRTVIAGGEASIVPAVAVLGLWTVGALAVTVLATRLRMRHPGPRPEPIPVGGGAA